MTEITRPTKLQCLLCGPFKKTHADLWSRVIANVSRLQNFSTGSGFHWCISMCLSTQKWTAFKCYYLEHLLCYKYKEKLEQSNCRSKVAPQAGRHFISMTLITMCFSYMLLCFKLTQNLLKAEISLHRILPFGLQEGDSSHLT